MKRTATLNDLQGVDFFKLGRILRMLSFFEYKRFLNMYEHVKKYH